MANIIRLVLTSGEPTGIGPDIIIAIAQKQWNAELIVIADPNLLLERAQQLKLPLQLRNYDEHKPCLHQVGMLTIIPIQLDQKVIPGELNTAHAHYVIRTLELATQLCLAKKADALVTGPVHKGILNEANILFTGHTEFFANYCQVPQTVMLFVVDDYKIALATTHLPLAKVPEHITQKHLRLILTTLKNGLHKHFKIAHPTITVCGLNPHAGENGHLGREEIEIITPLLNELRSLGEKIEGPISADTAFTETHLKNSDVILAMYHDQALPVVKQMGFGHAINVTLGLPFLRTSVDHGTALHLAGTNQADSGSMDAAITLAVKLINQAT